jgi:hypothetical protein
MVYPHVQYRGPAHPDPQQSQSPSPREVDSRTSDGINVRLLWHPADGHVSVAVHDTKTNEAFELPVGDGDLALDVYRHPYAYAAQTPPIRARARSGFHAQESSLTPLSAVPRAAQATSTRMGPAIRAAPG